MNSYGLHLRYRPGDEWIGEIDAIVKTDAFSGMGSAWFDRQQVKKTFVKELRAYPLSAFEPPVIEGGYWVQELPARMQQCHLRIAVRPHDARGALLVNVDLATPSWNTPEQDLQQSVIARFLTNYDALDAFTDELEQVLDGRRNWALLASRVN